MWAREEMWARWEGEKKKPNTKLAAGLKLAACEVDADFGGGGTCRSMLGSCQVIHRLLAEVSLVESTPAEVDKGLDRSSREGQL